MASDKRNSIMTKAMGLIFSLFDVTSAQQVPFGIPQYNAFFMDLPAFSFVSHSSLLTVKSVDLVIACNCFPCNGKCPSLFVIVAILRAEVPFKQLLIRTAV